MATVRNVILNVEGRTGEVVGELHNIADALRRIPNRRTTEVQANVANGLAKIKQMRDELQGLDRTKVSPEMSVEITKALVNLDKLERRLRAVSDISPEVRLKADKLMAEAARIEARLQKLATQDPQIEVDAKTARAEANLKKLRLELEALQERHSGRTGENIDLSVEIADAQAKINVLEAELTRLAALEPTVEIEAEVAGLMADLAAVRAALAALPNTATIDLSQRGDLMRDLLEMEGGLLRFTRGMERASRPARTFGDQVHDVTQKVKQLTPLVNGTAIIVGTALVPAFIALGGAAAGAISGLVGVAATLTSAVVPAVVGAVAVFGSFGKVLEAAKLRLNAYQSAQRQGMKGTQEAAAAADQRIAAANAERDAEQGLTTAKRGLGAASQAAADQIASAHQRMADAQRNAAQAAENVRRATVNAYREMEDAAEDVRDAILGIESAQLGMDEANLNLREAQHALKEFRQEAGLAGDAISNSFKKFTDVEIDFDASALDAALQGSGVSTDDQLELERRILAVRRAKLQEKQATDDLEDSEVTLKRARQDNLKFQQQGIKASEQLQGALEAQASAGRDLATATADYNELAKQGVAGAPGVVAALEGVRDAEERLQDARRRRKQQSLMPADAARAKQAVDDLTDSELLLLAAVERARTSWRNFQTAISGGAVGKAAGALDGLMLLLGKLQPQFKLVGDAIGSVFTNLGITLGTSVPQLQALTTGAADLIRAAGGEAFPRFVKLIMNLGQLFLPTTVDLLQRLAGWLGRAGDATGNFQKAQPYVDAFSKALNSIVGLAGAVLEAFIEFGRAVGPVGAELVDWISDGVRGFTKWMKSAEGQKDIRRFFEATIPAMKSLVRFVLVLGRVFLKFLQAVSPLLGGFVDGITFALRAVEKLLDVINWLTAGSLVQGILRLVGSFLGIGAVVRIGARILQTFGRLPAQVVEKLGNVGEWLSKPFVRAGRAVLAAAIQFGGKIIEGIKKALGISSPARAMFPIAADVIAGFVQGVARGASKLLESGAKLLASLLRGARDKFATVTTWVGDLVTKIGSAVTGVASRLLGIGKRIIWAIADGVKEVGDSLVQAVSDVIGSVIRTVEQLLDIGSPSKRFRQLGRWTMEGFVLGLKDSHGDVVDFMEHKFGKGVWEKAANAIKGKGGLFDFLPIVPDAVKDLFKGQGFILTTFQEGVKSLPHFGRKRLLPVSSGDPTAARSLLTRAFAGLSAAGSSIQAKVRETLIRNMAGLARGGLVTGPSIRAIGEGAYDEAVLPLSRRVMRTLAQAITSQMAQLVPSPVGPRLGGAAAPGAPGSGGPVYKIEKIVLEVPGGDGPPDGRASAVLLGRELERRGA